MDRIPNRVHDWVVHIALHLHIAKCDFTPRLVTYAISLAINAGNSWEFPMFTVFISSKISRTNFWPLLDADHLLTTKLRT